MSSYSPVSASKFHRGHTSQNENPNIGYSQHNFAYNTIN